MHDRASRSALRLAESGRPGVPRPTDAVCG
jgi:hypothetical protein